MNFVRIVALLIGILFSAHCQEFKKSVFVMQKHIENLKKPGYFIICSKEIIPAQVNVIFTEDPKLSSPNNPVGEVEFTKEDQKYDLVICRSGEKLICQEEKVSYRVFSNAKIGDNYVVKKIKIEK